MEEPIVTFGSESLILEMTPEPIAIFETVPTPEQVSVPAFIAISVPTPEPVQIPGSISTKKGWCVLS